MLSNALLEQLNANSNHTEGLQVDGDNFESLFSIQTANQWLNEAKIRPAPKMLFDEFWFEGELGILFADTNVGKSILGIQVADSIGKGQSIDGLRLEAPAQPVLYFDFELTDKQFESRYAERKGDFFVNHFEFSENLYRAEIDPNSFMPRVFGSFEEYLNFSIEMAVEKTGSRILIIDNLTYLRRETEKAKDALPLMKELKRLKNRHNLSILALAHTPKRDSTKPISRNDLQGSKMLINFCDSSFAIGESMKDKSLRYLKQIKVRNAEAAYTSDRVLLCQITKPANFLGFEFLDTGREREHLRNLTEKDRLEIMQKVKSLSRMGHSQREIASKLGISAMSVNRYLKKV